jgi:hypothetical protein
MENYTKQAQDFLKKHNAVMKIENIGYEIAPFFFDDKYRRTFKVTIKRNNKKWSFKFYGNLLGNNINEYDVLASITKYEPNDNLDGFLWEFGYQYDTMKEYRKYERLHKAVIKEYNNVLRLFDDCLEELQEIF